MFITLTKGEAKMWEGEDENIDYYCESHIVSFNEINH
jgi:hypothetical protein